MLPALLGTIGRAAGGAVAGKVMSGGSNSTPQPAKPQVDNAKMGVFGRAGSKSKGIPSSNVPRSTIVAANDTNTDNPTKLLKIVAKMVTSMAGGIEKQNAIEVSRLKAERENELEGSFSTFAQQQKDKEQGEAGGSLMKTAGVFAAAVGTLIAATSGAFDGIVENVEGMFGDVGETLSGFMDKVKSFLPDWITSPIDSAKNVASRAANSVGDAASDVGEVVGDAATSVGNTISNAAQDLGFISGKYESRGNVGTISTGKGDKGGKSYGKYQIASKTGTLKTYINQSKYKSEFEGLPLASAAFDRKWKELAKRDPQGFLADQHAFIRRTHYEPAAKYAKSLGYDMNDRAIQEMVWSGSVQHGGIKKILKRTANSANLGDRNDTINEFYKQRQAYALRYADRAGHRGIINRYRNERADILGTPNRLRTKTGNAWADAPVVSRSRVQPTGSGADRLRNAYRNAGPRSMSASSQMASSTRSQRAPTRISSNSQARTTPRVVSPNRSSGSELAWYFNVARG